MSRFFGPRYIEDDFFRVESSLIQSNSCSLQDLIVLESNCTKKDYFCCEEMTENNDKKIYVEQANTMTLLKKGSVFQWYRTYERGFEI